MITRHATKRSAAGAGASARMVVAGSAVMIAVTAWGLPPGGLSQAAAVVVAGTATITTPGGNGATDGALLNSGGSATLFSVGLPVGAACTGDSANGGYRVQSYMVPESVNPDTLTFASSGPLPRAGSGFRQPFFGSAGGSPYVNQQTAAADTVGGPGLVVSVPPFNFAFYQPGDVPAGTYNVGLACTLGPASATQLDKYWNTRMVVTAAAADTPAGITWAALQTTSTSSTVAGATTTTGAGGTTTTGAGGTTTTRATTTTAPVSTTTTASGSSVAGATTTAPGQLSRTGGNPTPLVVWAALLLVLGRMVILVTRRPEVPADAPR